MFTLLTENFESMRDELKHRQNECSRLRTLLASRHGANETMSNDSHGIDPHLINEDGELEMAYHTQMELNGSVNIFYLTNLLVSRCRTDWP